MKLICVTCGGFSYFEDEVETVKAVTITDQGLIVEDAVYDDWNNTDDVLRGNLNDIVNYVLKQPNETFKRATGNDYITCARCSSRMVVVPAMPWNPPLKILSLDEEIINNKDEYLQLRKERHCEDHLPLL